MLPPQGVPITALRSHLKHAFPISVRPWPHSAVNASDIRVRTMRPARMVAELPIRLFPMRPCGAVTAKQRVAWLQVHISPGFEGLPVVKVKLHQTLVTAGCFVLLGVSAIPPPPCQ